eukprot:351557-Chlamydomonas_euryale.AAC.2
MSAATIFALLLVAFKAHQRELCLDSARADHAEADVCRSQVIARSRCECSQRVLAGAVGRALVAKAKAAQRRSCRQAGNKACVLPHTFATGFTAI